MSALVDDLIAGLMADGSETSSTTYWSKRLSLSVDSSCPASDLSGKPAICNDYQNVHHWAFLD
jgi:hypothetical protein